LVVAVVEPEPEMDKMGDLAVLQAVIQVQPLVLAQLDKVTQAVHNK